MALFRKLAELSKKSYAKMDQNSKQIYNWITDYVTQSIYSEYKKTKEISNAVFNRDYLQGLLQALESMEMVEEMTNLEIQLISILCHLADGADHHIRYEKDEGCNEEEDRTTLELVLEDLGDLMKHCKHEVKHLEEFIETVRTQAVYVCCRAGAFTDAKKVLKRLEKRAKSAAEKTLMKKLKAVVLSEDTDHSSLTDQPFSSLHEAAITLLDPILNNMNEPFLVQASNTIRNSRQKTSLELSGLTATRFKELSAELDPAQRDTIISDRNWTPYLSDKELIGKWENRLNNIRNNWAEYHQRLVSSGVYRAENNQMEEGNTQRGTPHSDGKPTSAKHENDNSTKEKKRTQKRQVTDSDSDTALGAPSHQKASKKQRTKNKKDSTPTTNNRRQTRCETDSDSDDTTASDVPYQKQGRRHKSDQRRSRHRGSDRRSDQHGSDQIDELSTPIKNNTPRKTQKRSASKNKPDSDSDFDSDAPSLKQRLKVSRLHTPLRMANISPDRQSNRGGVLRRIWTVAEEESLYQLIQTYGLGRWSTILQKGNFAGRTNVHLKDKWRNMTKERNADFLEKLKDKYGDI